MPPSHPDARPTVREIARNLGLSASAVSLALRESPRISAGQRRRVRDEAIRIGYVPDPQIARLMTLLKEGRRARFQSVIAAFTSVPDETMQQPYFCRLVEGARQRAASLGYGWELFRIPDSEGPIRGMTRTLLARGVKGVILLPFGTPRAADRDLEWAQFAVVTATSGVLSPRFHRVTPDQFGDTLELCSRLQALGYRRIGLIFNRDHDLRTTRGHQAAVLLHNQSVGSGFVAPHLYTDARLPEVGDWFARERPDCILTSGEGDARNVAKKLGLEIPGPVGFAVSNVDQSSVMTGIEANAGRIGEAAVDVLHSKLLSGESGIPGIPIRVLIPGEWVAGESATGPVPLTSPRPSRRKPTL